MESKDGKQVLRSTMYRYMAKDVADQLLNSTDTNWVKGTCTEKEVSILFTHVFNYNSLAENLSLQTLHDVLVQLFEPLVDAVFQYQGTLNKYSGANLMAVYGSPLPVEDHAWMAVQSALLMRRSLQEFNAARALRDQATLDVKIGINSGIVMSGNIGSSRRLEFTVIGHEVNVAKHLSQLEHYPGYGVLMGENTYQLCAKRLQATAVDTIRLSPQGASARVYGLVGDELNGRSS